MNGHFDGKQREQCARCVNLQTFWYRSCPWDNRMYTMLNICKYTANTHVTQIQSLHADFIKSHSRIFDCKLTPPAQNGPTARALVQPPKGCCSNAMKQMRAWKHDVMKFYKNVCSLKMKMSTATQHQFTCRTSRSRSSRILWSLSFCRPSGWRLHYIDRRQWRLNSGACGGNGINDWLLAPLALSTIIRVLSSSWWCFSIITMRLNIHSPFVTPAPMPESFSKGQVKKKRFHEERKKLWDEKKIVDEGSLKCFKFPLFSPDKSLHLPFP